MRRNEKGGASHRGGDEKKGGMKTGTKKGKYDLFSGRGA